MGSLGDSVGRGGERAVDWLVLEVDPFSFFFGGLLLGIGVVIWVLSRYIDGLWRYLYSMRSGYMDTT